MYNSAKHCHALELDKVLAMLADQTSCDDSRAMALNIQPLTDFMAVNALMEKTSDAYMLSARFTSPNIHRLKNCDLALSRAEKGSNLSLPELLDVASLLRNIRSVKEWRSRCDVSKTSLDILFEMLYPNKDLEKAITNAIINEEEVADSASKELGDIRRKIRNAQLKIRDQLDKLVRSSSQSKYLQEALVTQRDGRFVVPVKSEYRSEIKGLVHDTSASGATVFIEPISVVEANNEIKVLQSKEKQEIDRILQELSARVGEQAHVILENYRDLLEIDLYFAKASLAAKKPARV